MGDTQHPATRFAAPSSIERGVPLKELMGPHLVGLIADSLSDVVTGFNRKRFRSLATRGLDELELKERALNIAQAMADQMPSDFNALVPLFIDSLGPVLQETEGNGLAPFFYLPHTQFVAEYGVSSFKSGMLANYELTQRFTAEFSIRPFLVEHRTDCLAMLHDWATDSSPHVRRLVTEGTRPRLPWAMRLREFQENPCLSLPLLEKLKDDLELYVCRSVANHLGDIAKDHPDVVFDVCEKWLAEVEGSDDTDQASSRQWIVRHALRHPAKKGTPRAVAIRRAAGSRR